MENGTVVGWGHHATMFQMKLLDTKAAAKRLKVSERRVRFFCKKGRLGTRVAGRWIITEEELRMFQRYPKPGRPPKKPH